MDIRTIMCPKDTQNLARVPRMQAIYDAQVKIAQEYQPKWICEIGVRAGYSAHAWITGSPKVIAYHGIDMDDQVHYGGPWLWWAKRLLRELQESQNLAWEVWAKDSQTLTVLATGCLRYDLVHVDGDHTYEGCLHDMNLCWPGVAPGGIMVVDDATYLPGPRKACAGYKPEGMARAYLEPSPTGSMIFVKEGE